MDQFEGVDRAGDRSMPKRSSKRKDINELAACIVEAATNGGKDPLAVELGRRGGKKGGLARAKKLTAEKRREIARNAAIARWKRKPER